MGVVDGADGAGVGSEGSLFDVSDVTDIHGVGLGKQIWALLKWGRDVGASAGGEDPTAGYLLNKCLYTMYCLSPKIAAYIFAS